MAECRGFKNKLGTTIVSLIAKVTGAIAGNIATFNSDGEVIDSGKGIDTKVTGGSSNLITSGAVYTEIAKKTNVGHNHYIEDITGLGSIIASLTERIRALEDAPITETITLTGSTTLIENVSYNILLNSDSINIFYDSISRKCLTSIDSLFNFAEVGSIITLHYEDSSHNHHTFETTIIDKIGGPDRLVLENAIPDVEYVSCTNITLTVKK